MSSNGESYSSLWTIEQDKAFETGLAIVSEDDFYRWQKIAEMVPGKTVEEVMFHYQVLVDDINDIESGNVPLPSYDDSPENGNFGVEEGQFEKKRKNPRKKSSRPKGERRKKGIPWTDEEHRLFLEGLARFGRGDWRSISRLCVLSRTPTQVASHAQKFFLRQKSSPGVETPLGGAERERPSVHDKGKGVESSSPTPSVGTLLAEAERGPIPWDPADISNFVPPTIVQSMDAGSSQMEIDCDDMGFFDGLPDITNLW